MKSHVWNARSSLGNQVVVKLCKLNTPQCQSDFRKEISQGQRFENADYIRRLLDVIEDTTEKDTVHGIVLEWFPETLWEARDNGYLASLGFAGIRRIMKDVLEGVQELHAEESFI